MNNDIRSILDRFDQVQEGQDAAQRSVPQLPALFKPKNISPVIGSKTDPEHPTKGYFVGGESRTTEDILSTVKKKLGDYIQDVATAIKKDPDLIDKIPQSADNIGPAVKTITTDDGHEIKIHGNEDDGFRITVKNKPHSAKFKNLDEASMAVEMFCNRRRQQDQNQDYIEERS
jgi:hypothetical protein